MITLKFGGTSMGDAGRILDSADIMISRLEQDSISVIVSAVAGVSNRLQDSIEGSLASGQAETYVSDIEAIHQKICRELTERLPGFNGDTVFAGLHNTFAEYRRLLDAVAAFGECPPSVHCRIMGVGELLCAPIVEAVLKAKGCDVILLDSRNYIFTTGNQKEGDPDYTKTAAALAPYKNKKTKSILLFPGFVCSWRKKLTDTDSVPGLLGRNGSDFSAAIVGSCLDASRVEFWTDVDGIYTADPRIVPDAILVENMTYEEAMELSFFGSKVLHPKTLAPLAAKGIEAWSLNSHNPKAKGTRIGKSGEQRETGSFNRYSGSVRGISCLKGTAMISVSGSGMKGRSGMAARIFAAVSRAGISVLLITQSSSEYTISFCVRLAQAAAVQDVLSSEFELEIRENLVNPIEVQENCAIVSIVGDGMKQKRGIAGTFFASLASKDINILAIAQGSSERSISVVIEGADGDLAVRIAHRFFFNTTQPLEVFIFGAGTIGGCLIDQIKEQQQELAEQKIDIKVLAIANSSKMLVASGKVGSSGLDLSNWREDLKNSSLPASVDTILDFVRENNPLNPVFVDCTASYDLPERYIDIFKAGMHIATPNKRANSMSTDYYHELRKVANKMKRLFLYETNVGAGLPIIDTLQNLFASGDRLKSFYGIMSGSLSYIFGRLDEGATFSQAVLEARDKKYTEPDPRDDLGGMDVARKTLIIAREAGFQLELEDIVIKKVFPDWFDDSGAVEDFLKNLPKVDAYFSELMSRLKAEGKVLRMAASIQDGQCSVGMMEVDEDHPLYSVKGGENAFVFRTQRYNPIPLSVMGYGAGDSVTAAGVFGDILRTVSWNPEV